MRAVVPVTVINSVITVSSRKIFLYLFIFSFSTIITVIKRDYSSVGVLGVATRFGLTTCAKSCAVHMTYDKSQTAS